MGRTRLRSSRLDSTTRRRLLGAGSAGLAGCLGEGEPTDAIQSPASESPPATAPATETPSPTVPPAESGRIGHTVYYDADNPGPYTDMQDAIADVPDGGTLQLGVCRYEVETEGRIYLERPIHLRGAGYTKGYVGENDRETYGTKLVNESVDEPIVEYDAANYPELKELRIEHLWVRHASETAPAVRFRDTSRTLLERCFIGCAENAPTGVKYEGTSYLGQQIQNEVRYFTDIGIHVTGPTGGYGYEFHQSVATSSVPDATAIQSEVNRAVIVGGEYAVLADGGTAIKFHNPHDRPISGGLVMEPGIERTSNPIVIDGDDYPFYNVQMYHVLFPLAPGPGVHFGNANACKLVNPVVPVMDGGKLAHWSSQSENCTMVTDPELLRRVRYSNDGARNPHIHVIGGARTGALEAMPTGVPTTVTYNPDVDHPVFHDGSSWRKLQSEPL